MVDPRWATFDCYGTLVDWNAGIGVELARLFGSSLGEALRRRYHALEPRVQAEHSMWSYREVMAAVLAELAAGAGVEVPAGERGALGRSLPAWPVFEEVPGELAEARRRGWRLGALSNSDRDLIDASIRAMGVPFDEAIVASEIGSIWINRIGERGEPAPTRELPDLVGLADVLDELVPVEAAPSGGSAGR
jgi:2-haloacid dehalogenase